MQQIKLITINCQWPICSLCIFHWWKYIYSNVDLNLKDINTSNMQKTKLCQLMYPPYIFHPHRYHWNVCYSGYHLWPWMPCGYRMSLPWPDRSAHTGSYLQHKSFIVDIFIWIGPIHLVYIASYFSFKSNISIGQWYFMWNKWLID